VALHCSEAVRGRSERSTFAQVLLLLSLPGARARQQGAQLDRVGGIGLSEAALCPLCPVPLGTRVFREGICVEDDPHRPHGLRSRPFDGDGLPVSPIRLIDDGMLETWLLDSASARKLGLEPTGHAARGVGGAPGVSTSNLYMEPGRVPVSTLIADIAHGVYVTELIGQGVNGVTGDYSRGASGFRIEGGQIAGPVAEFTIAGNLKEMYRALTPANDLEFRYGTNVPTIRIDGMTVAGG